MIFFKDDALREFEKASSCRLLTKADAQGLPRGLMTGGWSSEVFWFTSLVAAVRKVWLTKLLRCMHFDGLELNRRVRNDDTSVLFGVQ